MDKIEPDSIGFKLLTRDNSAPVNFDITEEVLHLEKKRVSNYFPNPEKNWGPKRAAAIVIPRAGINEKKKKFLEENKQLSEEDEEEQMAEEDLEAEREGPL